MRLTLKQKGLLMLYKIFCDKFRKPIVEFHQGLNIVRGDDNAANSIGKTTILLLIDFAYGGSDFIANDGGAVKILGEHVYKFTFLFDEEEFTFERKTSNPNTITQHLANETIEMPLNNYTAFLKKMYKIPEDISFRSMCGLFSRIWGKENLDVKRPLHVATQTSATDSITNLIKIFGQYALLQSLEDTLKEAKDKQSAINKALKRNIVPKITKTKYKENEKNLQKIKEEISDIRSNLAKYACNLNEIINREIHEAKLMKDNLLRRKATVANKLSITQRNLKENKHIKSHNLSKLGDFFPNVNMDRLTNIEEFHDKLSKALKKELKDSEQMLTKELERINIGMEEVDNQISSALKSVENPGIIVDRVYELATEFSTKKNENIVYDNKEDIDKSAKDAKTNLTEVRLKTLKSIADEINETVRKLVDIVYSSERKSPTIAFSETKYSYNIITDTGTGKSYSNLILFDLAVMKLTPLPFIVHDSLLFKNIENAAVSKIIDNYSSHKRQIFISIDEAPKFGKETLETIKKHTVIAIDNANVLYIKDWRTKN